MHVIRWLIAPRNHTAAYREVTHETLPGRCIHPGDLPRVGDFVNFTGWKYRVAHKHWSWEATPDGCLCSLAIVLEIMHELTEGGV